MEHKTKTYEGSQPFAFISYAHRNSDQVLPIIQALSERSYRIWYDSGIKSGDVWAATIASRLKASGCVICFLSRDYCNSHNCCNELIFALNKGSTIMVVYLEEFDLPDRIELQIAQAHAIHLAHYDTIDAFIAELERAECLQKCNSAQDPVDPAELYMQSGAMYMNNQPKFAREAYRLAIDIYEKTAGAQYQRFLPNLATAYGNIGKLYIRAQRYEDARPNCEKALQILRTLAGQDASFTPRLAETLYDLSVTYGHLHMFDRSLAIADESITLYEPLCQADIAAYGMTLSSLYLYLSDLFHFLERKEDMERIHRKAIAILEQLAEMDPKIYQQRLASACYFLGTRLIGDLRLEDAIALCDQAIHIMDQLCAADPDTFEPILAHLLWELGMYYKNGVKDRGRIDPIANAVLRKALALYEKLDEQRPGRYTSCINGIEGALHH